MLLGYTEHDKNEDAIQLYLQMLVQGLLPNMMTFSGMLKSCGNMGDIQKREQLPCSNVLVKHGGHTNKCLIEKHA